ncbi:hypothetical protein ACJIZ3_002738 [Penstemon smallii]|uniref:TFIIS N-terminal domain-containing protein n=1 Tax=Penstemon smallii TaxID=265156 RepID=A0ABD3UA90_9LAMI
MTLDDFFTLTEMNNGLTAPSRVRELVAVMKKDKDCDGKNVGDSTRQWSAVASAIVATENKDCLDLFIQSEGLHFIDKWLKDAQKFSNDTNDSFVEESIAHMLQALQKLLVDCEKLVASDIWSTVKDLLAHNSSMVKDKARELFESWERKRDGVASLSDVEKTGALTDDEVGRTADIEGSIGHSESVQDVSLANEISGQEKGQESTRDDPLLSVSSNVVHPGQVETAPDTTKILEPPVEDDRSSDHVGSPSHPKPAKEPLHCLSIGTTTFESCSSAVSRQDTLDDVAEFRQLESPVKQTSKIEGSPEKLVSLEESKALENKQFTSCSDAVDAMESVTEPSVQKLSTTVEKDSSEEGSLYTKSSATGSEGKGAIYDSGHANQYRSTSDFSAKEGGFKHHMVHKSSSSEKILENSKDLGTFHSGIEDDGMINKLDLHISDLANNYNFAKKDMDRGPHRAGKKSDVELDYGIVDPLELARQVAMEVEREVVDYGEQSCSSSEKLRERNKQQQESPNSASAKQGHASEGSLKEVADDPYLSGEASPMGEESATSTETLDAEQTNGTQDMEMETSQVTEAAQDEPDTEKGVCNFDLNDEVCSEEADHPENQLSTPVSIVSASRAAAASAQPVAPLQFEGNLGWKGSATTSAFRPASPRRMPESDKDLSTGRSNSSPKREGGFLDFDLNVAESVDARMEDLLPAKNVPFSISLPSGESSVETNSRRSEHLELDLNRANEDSVQTDWRIGQFFPLGNGHHSRSNSSSSSSKQPSLRNIDLNDQPSFLNDSSDRSFLSKLSQNVNVSGGIKSDDSAISIMGTRVEVNRKELVSQTLPLLNGRTPELSFDANMGRSGSFLGIGNVIPYSHSSVYGYNNIAPGPPMPFSSTVYGSGGPIPYMVDSRGAPVIPQLMGSASPLPNFSQQPFLLNMNMSSTTPSSGVGPSRSTLDLNSGTMMESSSRDPAGFGQFLNEQLRSNGKRKEPENGWEHYPFRQYTPPWK